MQMRQKLITALSLVIVFSVVFSTQLATTASAYPQTVNPVTSPVTFFKITGNVTYKFFKFFRHNGQRFAPAPGVTITAENIFTKHKVQTTTDASGKYTLGLNEKGIYLVSPSGGDTSTYLQPLQVVHANKSGEKNNVNFTGLILP